MTTMSRRYLRRGGAALATTFILIGPVRADDATLRERIEARLGKSGVAEHGQVDVEVRAGTAVLSGFTTTVDA